MKLIIFDIDGTLCHSRYIDDKCYIQAFKKVLGIDIQNTDWDSYKHVTDHHITRQILETATGKLPDIQTIELIIDHYSEELKIQLSKEDTSFTEIPGAVDLFKFLSSSPDSYHIGIATGGFQKTALHKLNRIGINLPADQILSSDNYATKQEMILNLISKEEGAGKSFEKVIYVGDREYDCTTARELNIDFIGIDFRNNGKLKSLGAEKVIDNYLPIEKFLDLL